MVGQHHQLHGHKFGQSPGDGERREPGVLQSMGCKESDMTEQLNNNSQWLELYTSAAEARLPSLVRN